MIRLSLAKLVVHVRLRWIVLAALLVLLLAAAGLALLRQPARAASPQSLTFSHQKHVEAGAPCVYCHPGVINGPVAGLPSLSKCMGCHNNVEVSDEKDQPDVDALLHLWEQGKPALWAKVNDQPDFVYFSHRPHVLNGVSCESCHGDVSHMGLAQPVYNMNMGFCLNCHRQQAPEKVARLVDCKTCHK